MGFDKDAFDAATEIAFIRSWSRFVVAANPGGVRHRRFKPVSRLRA
jgi:hypothetical protein